MARTRSFRGRFQRRGSAPAGDRPDGEEVEFVAIETHQLASIFTPPSWLRDMGLSAWLVAGVVAVLVGAVWLLALTSTIVVPVITAAIIAAVLAPLVDGLERRGAPRALGAALVLLAIALVAVVVMVVVLTGIASQSDSLSGALRQAVTTIEGWLADLGVGASDARQAGADASSGASDAVDALLHGLAASVAALTSIAVFVSFTALSLFFLLKDGPTIRDWTERHLGVPRPVARIVTGRTLGALRGYFAGVTVVAAFNGIVIGLGALVVGVPLAGSIAVVNFLAAYVPYLGAWTAGAFTVLIALGAEGTAAAVAMVVVVLLANGILQQLIQPIAYGAALKIHPLAVLIVTIAGGAIFGTIGLVLAAPVTSAVVRISADLAGAREREREEEARSAAPTPDAGAGAPAPGDPLGGLLG